MNDWWQRRTLKLRLTLWYATVTAGVVTAFAWAAYEVVEHRLAAEIDRQLRIDFDLVEAQLEVDPTGEIQWLVHGAHGDEGFARLSTWFEVWSEDKHLRFRHWPVAESGIKHPLPAPQASGLQFHTTELEPGLQVRVMERPARLRDHGVVVRLLRDESDMRRTLGEISEVFLLTGPLAVLLAALGGYVVAHRALRPVAAMAAQARKITSESLEKRLPNPNPHDELGELATVFNETLRRLENSFAELRRFTADASHELRTPLTALRTVGEVALRTGEDPAALRETIGSMLEEAQRLEELVESLLTLARVEGGQVALHLEPVRLAETCAEVRDSLSVLATEKQQTIELGGEEDLVVSADRRLLRQALLNLVHNAVRHAPPHTCVAIRTCRRGHRAVVEIIDEGPGIARVHHERIFDRFFRVDKARTRDAGGTGLGLAIAKWSIERQGGRIEIESEIGHGSVFRIVLPA